MRRVPVLVVFLALASLAAVALAKVESTPPALAAVRAASGSFEISNSDEGRPIFSATGISPGDPARGTVAIEDTGSEPVALTLRRGELIDVPGLGGDLLSGRLRLTVVDITDPTTPRAVYSGSLDAMPEQAAGRVEGGEARTFEFTATLPEEGGESFQNAVQGASTTVAYSWVASEVSESPAAEPRKETPNDGGAATSTASGGGDQSAGGVKAAVAALELTVTKIRRGLRGGLLVATTDCDRSCHLSVRGRLRATAAGRRRLAQIRFAKKGFYEPGAQRLRIPAPRVLRRWLREGTGRERLRARLRFVAVDTNGERAAVRKTVKLRVQRR